MLPRRLRYSSILGLVALAAPGSSGAENGMKEGQIFPDLHLPSLETGKLERTSSFRGRKTLVLVYASW